MSSTNDEDAAAVRRLASIEKEIREGGVMCI